MPRLSDEYLAEVQKRCDGALPGPWDDNSYSGVMAPLPYPHPWGQFTHDGEGPNTLGGDFAWVCWIAQAPEHQGHGDELHSAQARANMVFVRDARRDVPAVLAALREAVALNARYREAIQWCLNEGGWRLTYYELSGPPPEGVFDRSDTFNPLLADETVTVASLGLPAGPEPAPDGG